MTSNNDIVVTFEQKLRYAIFPAILFVLVSLPQIYNQTDKIGEALGPFSYDSFQGACPTPTGKFLHALVFFVLNYLSLKFAESRGWMNKRDDGVLAKYAFYGTLIFFLIASSDTYRLTGRFVEDLANDQGCPSLKGIIVHGLVFLVVLTLVMYFPKDC